MRTDRRSSTLASPGRAELGAPGTRSAIAHPDSRIVRTRVVALCLYAAQRQIHPTGIRDNYGPDERAGRIGFRALLAPVRGRGVPPTLRDATVSRPKGKASSSRDPPPHQRVYLPPCLTRACNPMLIPVIGTRCMTQEKKIAYLIQTVGPRERVRVGSTRRGPVVGGVHNLCPITIGRSIVVGQAAGRACGSRAAARGFALVGRGSGGRAGRRSRLREGAVDLVAQHDVREHRTRPELESLVALVVDELAVDRAPQPSCAVLPTPG
jgi:hypothetical protein